MFVMIYNFKGSQGKTMFALNLQLTRPEYAVVVNDPYTYLKDNVANEKLLVLSPGKEIPGAVFLKQNVIFDFGGYIDNRALKALKKVDVVIIPIVTEGDPEIKAAIKTIRELERYNKNIVLVNNKSSEKEFEKFKKEFAKFNYPMFHIRFSKSIHRLTRSNNKLSVKDMCAEGCPNAHQFLDMSKSFDKIYREIFK
jgi:MinD-like ATPase involved in chromosome partitioning or flagellar assembly